ncbi:MAG: Clp protease N-terminal domain-containing protein [Tepidisphaeraceae bacterium]
MRLDFTKALSAALLLADEQARQLGQEFVGTEHLLLGIVAGKSGDAYRALEMETNIEQLLPALKRALPKAAEPPLVTGRLPLSPKAQRAINTAVSLAQVASLPSVSTRFVLLALLADRESAIGQLLGESGADLEELRGVLKRGSEIGEE